MFSEHDLKYKYISFNWTSWNLQVGFKNENLTDYCLHSKILVTTYISTPYYPLLTIK